MTLAFSVIDMEMAQQPVGKWSIYLCIYLSIREYQ